VSPRRLGRQQNQTQDISRPCSSSWRFFGLRRLAVLEHGTVTEGAALFWARCRNDLRGRLHAAVQRGIAPPPRPAAGRCMARRRYWAATERHPVTFLPATNKIQRRLRTTNSRTIIARSTSTSTQHSARCVSVAEVLKATVGARYYRSQQFGDRVSGFPQRTSAPLFGTRPLGCHAELNLATFRRQHDALRHHLQGLPPAGPIRRSRLRRAGQRSYAIRADSVWNYELGEKLRFLGGRVSIAGDLFYIAGPACRQVARVRLQLTRTRKARPRDRDASAQKPELLTSS